MSWPANDWPGKATTGWPGSTWPAGSDSGLLPLAISDASQAPLAVYSLRKVIPAYAGNCMQVRDSTVTLRTVGFVNGVMDTSQFASWGDGVTFTVALWNDQSGNARNLTATTRPILVFPNAPTNYSGAYVDFQSKNQNMATALTFLNAGGTDNITLLAVAGTFGWSSSGTHARNPAVYSSVSGPLVGYGTTSGGALLFGAYGANGETVGYNKEAELLIEEGTPTSTRIRQLWTNQTGANVSGGNGENVCFTSRPHGVTGAATQRLVLGNRGDLAQSHNGPVWELAVWQSGTALTDEEVRRLAKGQLQAWPSASQVAAPDRYFSIFSGQSLAQYYDTSASYSGGGVDSTTYAKTRVYIPELQSLTGFAGHPEKTMVALANTTATGNSSVLRRDLGVGVPDGPGGTSWLAWDGATDAERFWWDQYNDIPGPVYVLWRQDALRLGAKYRRTVVMWSQGEREATFIQTNGEEPLLGVNYANWKTYTKSVWAQMRTDFGATVPIVIQPLGRQADCDAQMTIMRALQNEMAAEVTDATLSPDTYHLTRQDSVHFAAGPADPDGFDRGALQLARTMAFKMGATTQKYDAPYITGGSKGGAVITLNVGWTANGGGSSVNTIDAGGTGVVGFTVTDGSGARTISSAVAAGTTITLTLSGGSVSGTANITYDPLPSGLNRAKMVVDNLSPGLPLRPTTLTV